MAFFFIVCLYNAVLLPLASAAFFIGSWFSKKLDLRVRGVHASWLQLAQLQPAVGKRVWFHASSMGEFEQAKPIIEALKKQHPHIHIVVSFFSPSGYEHQKNYSFADMVLYMPLDTIANARRFVSLLQPDAAVFVRYDIWRNHLAALHRNGIPTVLVCATLNPKSLLLSATFLAFTRSTYNLFSAIYTAGKSETQRFTEFAIAAAPRLQTSVDTRFDRIAAQVQHAREHPVLPRNLFAPTDIVCMAGSTWEPDETMLLQAYNSLHENIRAVLRLVIVPHEPTVNTVQRLMAALPNAKTLSSIEQEIQNNQQPVFKHIIVDSIGKLLRLYTHAHGAYIGGGFGDGVHSVTEPAGYGLPLACGPDISRARDAIALHERGALTVLNTVQETSAWLTELCTSATMREQQGTIAHNYVYSSVGHSTAIANDIGQHLLIPHNAL